MQTPLPLLIAVFGLAALAAPAQEASPNTGSTKPAEPAAEQAKPHEKKSAADTKKPETKQDANPEQQAPKKKTVRRVPFAERPSKSEAESSEERPRSFWERLFGIRPHHGAAPEPETPEATPAPKVVPRPKKAKPATVPEPETATAPAAPPAPKTAKLKTAEKAPEKETAAVDPLARVEQARIETSVPKATPAPKSQAKSKGSAAVAPAATPARKTPVPPTDDADTDAQEKYRFEVAKNKALEDAEVRKLKEKADGATSDDEEKKARRAYNKALFNKMRSIDGTIKDRADRIEAVIMKRLDTPE